MAQVRQVSARRRHHPRHARDLGRRRAPTGCWRSPGRSTCSFRAWRNSPQLIGAAEPGGRAGALAAAGVGQRGGQGGRRGRVPAGRTAGSRTCPRWTCRSRRRHRSRRRVLRRAGRRARARPARCWRRSGSAPRSPGTAITGSGSLRLLEPGIDRPRSPRRASGWPPRAPTVGRRAAPSGGPGGRRPSQRPAAADPRYDIDVMRREILTIPDVISDVLDDADGQDHAPWPSGWPSAASGTCG